MYSAANRCYPKLGNCKCHRPHHKQKHPQAPYKFKEILIDTPETLEIAVTP